MAHVRMIGILSLLLFARAEVARAQEFPQFNEYYWAGEVQQAQGKAMRGAGLEVFGLASLLPTVMLIQDATEDPRGYAAYALMAGIGSIGALLHGHFSVVFGGEQRRRSERMLKLYRTRPESLNVFDERAYYLWSQKKTTKKVITFGAVLVAESVIALSSAISRSVLDSRGEDAGGSEIWPAYVVGGIFLPGGLFIIARNAAKLKKLNQLEGASALSASAVSFAPLINRDPSTGSTRLGLSASWVF